MRPAGFGAVLAAVVLTACSAPGSAASRPTGHRSTVERSFATDRSVGALLVRATDGTVSQLCSASVVHSVTGDVIATAAHCVGAGTRLSFAPGYRDGEAPFGTWPVLAWHTDAAWQDHADPDDDYAFLTVAPSGSTDRRRTVESVVGAFRLGRAPLVGDRVTVIGYPMALHGQRLTCTTAVRATREFPTVDCPAFSNGTSGGPLLLHFDPLTGTGTLAGVIGGLETGGCTADISYASPFTADTLAVFHAAERHDPDSPAPRTSPATDC